MSQSEKTTEPKVCGCVNLLENVLHDEELREELREMADDTDYITAIKVCSQAWGCLTPSENLVLMFIINRTYRFKKTTERIPMRHFLKGVYGREFGDLIQSPCGLKSHTTVKKAIDGLLKKSLVDIEELPWGNKYTVNPLVLRVGCLQCRAERTEQNLEELIQTFYL